MNSSRFPFEEKISLSADLKIDPALVVSQIGPSLTLDRRQKIDRVIEQRCYDVAVVLEGIYDRGNISAVMRTAEALGFGQFHIIETQEKFKEANRVTQGSDKWVEVKKWKTTTEAVEFLKAREFQICVTSLEASTPMSEIDFSKPTAFVLGNEKDGVSAEMLKAADHRVVIPMQGFVQSFNISVAGALGLYHIQQDRKRRSTADSDLSEEQKQIIRAHYYMRTQDSAKDSLKELFQRGQWS